MYPTVHLLRENAAEKCLAVLTSNISNFNLHVEKGGLPADTTARTMNAWAKSLSALKKRCPTMLPKKNASKYKETRRLRSLTRDSELLKPGASLEQMYEILPVAFLCIINTLWQLIFNCIFKDCPQRYLGTIF